MQAPPTRIDLHRLARPIRGNPVQHIPDRAELRRLRFRV